MPVSTNSKAPDSRNNGSSPRPGDVLLSLIKENSTKIISLRDDASRAEKLQYRMLRKYLVSVNASSVARKLGITPAYLSDVKYGRRTFSDEVLKGLGGL